jgi:CRISPR-associated protein Csm1
MDSTKKSLIVASLLHDIGKVGQRAQKRNDLSKQTLTRESEICPGSPYPTHQHVLWTHEFFEKHFSDELKSLLFGGLNEETNPLNLASFHHRPSNNLQELIQIADRTSSGEREETERGEKNSYITKKLASIFNKISLKDDTEGVSKPYFHELGKLSLERDVFPVSTTETSTEEGTSAQRRRYGELWDGFIKDFQRLSYKTLEHDFEFDLFLSALYHLLMKYTWCVPSYTNAKQDIDNDISLFDHSRITAAIASCLYDVYGTDRIPSSPNHNEFVVAEGDISGIQKFLYKLSRPSGLKGVGRILRGRSMFLTLLPIVIANYFAKELGQTMVNILYAGGGNFQLLLPNKKEILERLTLAREEIDDWLFGKFLGELGVVIAHVEAGRSELGKNYGAVIARLKVEMENAKAKKFLKPLFVDDKFKIAQSSTLCQVCGSFDAEAQEDGEMLCGLCTEHRELGAYLPRAGYLVTAPDTLDLGYGERVDFGPAGRAWFLDELKEERKLAGAYSCQKINSTDEVLGFRFLGKSVPRAKERITKDDLGEEREIEEGEYEPRDTISFDHLDLLAEGDKKLGVLRMDVDNLGLIFSIGLRRYTAEGGEGSGHSISRSATLSRMLDWFFTGYLNTLCDEISRKAISSSSGLLSKVDGFFYIVYSGGDDLFIVAPWDKALELAFQIRKELREFCANNESVDISGGLSLVGRKFPVSRSAELAKELEEKAKNKAKRDNQEGCLAAFGEVEKWNVLKEGFLFGDVLVRAVNGVNGNRKLPRTFLNRVLEIRKIAGKHKDEPGKAPLFVPELVYSIVRNVDEKLKVSAEGRDFWLQEELMNWLVYKERGIEDSGLPIKYALLKTRRR